MRLIVLVSLFLIHPFSATAEIVDNAGFFDRATRARAQEEIRSLQKTYKSGIDIFTYKTVPGLKLSGDPRMAEAELTGWLETRAGKVNGHNMLVLAIQNPPYLMVSLGTVLRGRSVFSPNDRNSMVRLLADRFRTEEMNKGLLELVSFVRSTFSNRIEGTNIPTFTERITQQMMAQQQQQQKNAGPSSLLNWVGLVLVLVFGGWLAYNVYQTFANTKKGLLTQRPAKETP